MLISSIYSPVRLLICRVRNFNFLSNSLIRFHHLFNMIILQNYKKKLSSALVNFKSSTIMLLIKVVKLALTQHWLSAKHISHQKKLPCICFRKYLFCFKGCWVVFFISIQNLIEYSVSKQCRP